MIGCLCHVGTLPLCRASFHSNLLHANVRVFKRGNPSMDRREFESEFKSLTQALGNRGNPDSFHSKNCVNCSQCMFCEDCENCHGCHYTTESVDCTHCTHTARSTACHQSSHLLDCTRCVGSHYLTHCQDCAECTYCFGCVGLVRKEFHILNRPYDRKSYFALVKALTEAGVGVP